jgi:integrase
MKFYCSVYLHQKSAHYQTRYERDFGALHQFDAAPYAHKFLRPRSHLDLTYAVDELRQHKEKQAEELAKLRFRQTQETLVCAKYDGEPIWPSSVTHEFMKAIRKLPNLPRIRFHDLRHSHATQLLAAGIHPKIAQERLGHSMISTTLDLYSHVTDTMQDEAATKLDNAFRAVIKSGNSGPQSG